MEMCPEATLYVDGSYDIRIDDYFGYLTKEMCKDEHFVSVILSLFFMHELIHIFNKEKSERNVLKFTRMMIPWMF
jgi:hypothetical protein